MAKFPKAANDPNSRLRLARKKWNCWKKSSEAEEYLEKWN
jgi:hypothetical protein